MIKIISEDAGMAAAAALSLSPAKLAAKLGKVCLFYPLQLAQWPRLSLFYFLCSRFNSLSLQYLKVITLEVSNTLISLSFDIDTYRDFEDLQVLYTSSTANIYILSTLENLQSRLALSVIAFRYYQCLRRRLQWGILKEHQTFLSLESLSS